MCIILYTKIKDNFALVKNRNSVYKRSIFIVHTLINGIEVVYLHDTCSGWVEGMNEYGTSITNTTLNLHDTAYSYMKNKKVKKSKIYHALGERDTQKILNTLTRKDKNYVLEGHTFAYINGVCYHIENNLNNEFIIKKAKLNDVYTNHGKELDEGFTKGKGGFSSYLSQKIVKKELHPFTSYDDIAYTLNKNYVNINPRYHTYHDARITKKFMKDKSNKNYISTTGQIIMNVNDKEFIYYADKHNSTVKYINALPKNYIPRIRVIIKDVEKRMTPQYKIFTKSFLRKTYKKYT